VLAVQPVEDVTSNSVICNTGFLSPISSKVINVQAGSSMAAWWGHVIGGPQVANDPDNPIAATHHGESYCMSALVICLNTMQGP
jgi:cellulase